MSDIKTIDKGRYDVIVAGGGIAGIASAVSAARENKKVLLIEKRIDLGGLATIGLISWFEPLCDGNRRQMVAGIGEELIRLAVGGGYDNLPPDWGGTSGNRYTSSRYSSFYSPAFFSLNLDKFLRENGVEILYDTLVTWPVMEGSRLKGVTVENIDGRSFYSCKIIVDATGDATIASRAGVPTRTADNVQTLVLHDTDRGKAEEFVKTGDMTFLRHWEWLKPDEGLLDGITVEKENEYLKKCKKAALERYGEGNKNEREILSLPQMPQIRVIRTITGEKVFRAEERDRDVPVSDSIGSIGDFLHSGSRYDVPFGVLYNQNFPNILCAGRIVSAEKNGINVLRVIPGCAVTGQAAGVAAAVAAEESVGVSSTFYPELRRRLEGQGVLFGIK